MCIAIVYFMIANTGIYKPLEIKIDYLNMTKLGSNLIEFFLFFPLRFLSFF